MNIPKARQCLNPMFKTRNAIPSVALLSHSLFGFLWPVFGQGCLDEYYFHKDIFFISKQSTFKLPLKGSKKHFIYYSLRTQWDAIRFILLSVSVSLQPQLAAQPKGKRLLLRLLILQSQSQSQKINYLLKLNFLNNSVTIG